MARWLLLRGLLPRWLLLRWLLLWWGALAGATAAVAADPQPYRIDMRSTDDSQIDDTLKATSELESLRDTAAVSPFGLIARARSDVGRLRTVLESFGYYQSSVTMTIDGLPLDDPALADELAARPADSEAQIRISFTLGPLYHVRQVILDGDEVPLVAAQALDLSPGDPAIASTVLAAGEKMLSSLEDQGYAFAKVDTPIAHEDPADRVLDISFHVVTGPQVQIGEIRIRGRKRATESMIRRRLLVHTDEPYNASRIEAARKDLLALGIFGAVSVRLGKAADDQGRVPITFNVRERPLHAAGINVAYSSDLGGSTGINWTNRNVFGNAEQLSVTASAINLGGGTATNGIGYDTSVKYTLPDFARRDQSLQFSAGAIKQSLDAYDQQAVTLGAAVTRKLSSVWTASVGVTAEREHIVQESLQTCPDQAPPSTVTALPKCSFHYTLVALPLGVQYNTTQLASPLDDPTHGIRAALTVSPTLSIGRPNSIFLVSQISASTYFDLKGIGMASDPGRKVLALRALAGSAQGAGLLGLPPDQRFYAGGSGTVRGYRYQSVGDLFPDGNPIGGTAMSAGSVEYRQRFGKSLGMAVFLDGGQVSSELRPFSGQFLLGTGAGVRYYTPIGPIRVDVAVPLDRRRKHFGTYSYSDDAFEVYIGIGQAF